MDLSLPEGLPYTEPYLTSAEVESSTFCKLDVSHILRPVVPAVP